jgi:hypothetical protein
MSEQPQNNNGDAKKDRPLSEISHLFLSSVRDRQTNGAPRPQRKPPQPRADVSIDLTPEEFAQVYGSNGAAPTSEDEKRPAVTAIIGAHLNGKLFDRVKEYASHLCGTRSRIGLIEVDAAELRLMLFERSVAQPSQPADAPIQVRPEEFDLRRITEALEELSWDVEQWLLLLPNPRTLPAQSLLREVNDWVLLSTCDHDGLVAGYRTLKGMTEIQAGKPNLSLALLDAASEVQAEKVYQKLASVSQQFLSWPMESQPPVRRRDDVIEHVVLVSRIGKDSTAAPQWSAVMNFITRGKSSPVEAAPILQPPPSTKPSVMSQPKPTAPKPARELVADVVIEQKPMQPAAPALPPREQIAVNAAPQTPRMTLVASQPDDVIELPAGQSANADIIGAVIRNAAGEWIQCPVKPPMCPDATVAVGRDRRLLIIAVAQQGLSDLRAIGRAYQWLTENRALVAMAVPQLSIDAEPSPRLQLLVDHADLSAEILQPMFQSSNVTVQAYRKLRWGGRTGLLLNAA